MVLFASTWGGFPAGAWASLAATACFNFFFLPPIGTFHIADPDNWTALAAFLISAGLASRLVTRAREQVGRAESRAREIEAVNALSVSLLARAHQMESLGAAAGEALLTIGARGAGVILHGPEGASVLAWTGGSCPPGALDRAAGVRAVVQTVASDKG